MPADALAAALPTPATADLVPELLVAWQHPKTRAIQPVGRLGFAGGTYRFRYLRAAGNVAGFRPFLGLPRLDGHYEAEVLFPVFATRVMSGRRPDYPEFLRTLDLEVGAAPMQILARSEGRRDADTVLLFPLPQVAPNGATSCTFLVHGVRHAAHTQPGVEDLIEALSPGDALQLVEDPENSHNPRALLTAAHGIRLGYVPDLLLDYVYAVRDAGPYAVTVQHANGSHVAFNQRLLARITGRIAPGSLPFDGPNWETF